MICKQCKYLRTFRLSMCKNIDMYECLKEKCFLPKLKSKCNNFTIKEDNMWDINKNPWKDEIERLEKGICKKEPNPWEEDIKRLEEIYTEDDDKCI